MELVACTGTCNFSPRQDRERRNGLVLQLRAVMRQTQDPGIGCQNECIRGQHITIELKSWGRLDLERKIERTLDVERVVQQREEAAKSDQAFRGK